VTSEFRVGITIRQARPEVAAVMFDVRYLPAWLSGVGQIEVVSGEPPAETARVALGNQEFEIVEHLHDLTLVLQGKTTTLTLALEGVPIGTVAWLDVQTERTGLGRLLSRIIDHRERRIAIRDLRRLKQFIESGEYRTWRVEAEAEA
jgi:hypothetical protein